VSRWMGAVAAALVVAAAVAAAQADASRSLRVGVYDNAQIYGFPNRSFPMLRQLRAQLIRVDMYWGGRSGVFRALGVARRRPSDPADPDDPAYNWAVYDRTVQMAARQRIGVVFSIVGTPPWANGGRAPNRAPRRALDLQRFAYAAATRYSGTFVPAGTDEEEEEPEPLPAVRMWLAWNEPNVPVFLFPQWRRVGRRFRIQSAIDYAKICNAIWTGIHQTALRNEKVACGVTAPRGNNSARSSRPSVSPLPFLRAMKKAGARRFEAYAHHPYYGRPTETPRTPPPARTAVTLGNINTLIRELTRLYGPKRLWVTEYGYQTRPPDPFFGVSLSKQAAYLRQAFAIARRNPRIDMMIWFLLRDERRLRGRDGWQSGFMTVGGRRKPAFRAFQRLPH
jgi:Glycosyl hydrolase catalytic core